MNYQEISLTSSIRKLGLSYSGPYIPNLK